MATELVLADLDTADLQAALFGESNEEWRTTVSVESDQSNERTSPQASASGDQDESERQKPEEPEAEVEPKVDAGVATEADSPASSEQPLFRNVSEVEDMAIGLRSRNPDLSLEAALVMAKARLGLDEPAKAESGEEPQQSITDRIAELEAALGEAGANDELYSSKIAAMSNEHARLTARMAASEELARYNDQVKQEAASATMRDQRRESYKRAVEMCADASDDNTAIGRMVSKVVDEAQQSRNPLLNDPQAPEIFLAIANARLPEAERVELKRPAGSASAKTGGMPGGGAAQVERGHSPASVLPVTTAGRAAQSATLTIDPSNVGRVIRELSTADLESALLGEARGTALLRL